MNPHTFFTTTCSLQVNGPQQRIVTVKAEVSKYDEYIIVHNIQPLNNEQIVTKADRSTVYIKIINVAQSLNIPDDFVGQPDPYTATYLAATGQTSI